MKETIKEYMVNFLAWIKENNWCEYKDGTWYTTNERPYIKGTQRKFYTEEEVVELYLKS